MRFPMRPIFPAALVAALSWAAPSLAQQDPGKKVNIQTVDGVTLHGRFYSGKSADSATVLLLHALGGKSTQKAWTDLAISLQKAGYSVMAFDFRGHGTSTSVDPEIFWSKQFPYNGFVNGAREKSTTIDFKGFNSKYYPALINDIAAVKAYLDRKNDSRECNTSSLIVIGAETGATLGAIWMNSEWHRYKVKTDPIGNPLILPTGQFMPDMTKPEGEATICGVWLSMTPTLGTRKITLSTVLQAPAKEKAVPMIFMYSSDDKTGKTFAKALEKSLVGSGKKTTKGTKSAAEEKYKFTAAVEIPGSALKGADLLLPQLPTTSSMLEYLEGVVQAKGKEWMERDFRKTAFVWTGASLGRTLLAKNINEQNMVYNTYEMFGAR